MRAHCVLVVQTDNVTRHAKHNQVQIYNQLMMINANSLLVLF